ncbi:MAG: ABC transporter ATP-binding protein [Tissierellia bacterium]|nr:ABC transporter ATP-binding protein [Tissierellia bacterium]
MSKHDKSTLSNPTSRKITSPENVETGKILFRYIYEKHKFKIFIVIFLVLLATIANVGFSLFLRTLIDDYILPLSKMETPNFRPLFIMLSKMALLFLSGVIASLLYSRMMVDISEGTLNSLRKDLFFHMETLPISYFDQKSHGDIMSYYTNDVQALGVMISNSLPGAIQSIATITFIVIAMLYSSLMLSLVVFLCVLLMLFVMNKIGGRSSEFFLKQQRSLAEENGYIEEMFHGLKVIKVFHRESEVVDQFEQINDRLAHNTMMANRLSLFLIPVIFNIGNLQYAFIAIAGGLMALSPRFSITVGTIASFLQLSKSFSGPMRQISQQLNQVVLALAGGQRIFEFLREKPEQDEGVVQLVRVRKKDDNTLEETTERTQLWAWKDPEHPKTYIPLEGDIRFDHVSFAYSGENYVLHDINLYAKPGQKVAFVGATGAGKTTITNLINRFYDIQKGTITYDGIDIQRIEKSSLRRSLGMVLQDTHLFTGTIAENLRFGRPDASQERIVEASKRVQADHFISKLPNGYDTVISGIESDLSQGQSQLLSIGRVEVYDPPVMILDEATSSIDSRTEMIVQKGMDQIMRNRTSFVIAHRLSTIMNSDVIIVLDKGRIVERGNHEELLKQKGLYYKLYTGGFEKNS